MNTIRHLVLLVLLNGVGAVLAQTVPETFALVRSDVASGDAVNAQIAGMWRDGCTPYRYEVVRNGTDVSITVITPADDSPATILCVAAATPWSLTVDLGRFAAGAYTVRAQFRASNSTPRGPLPLTVRASVSTPTGNVSDAWYSPDEPGWGLTLIEQEQTTFATWYVYTTAGQPLWLVMPGGRRTGNVIEGDVFETRGTAADLAWRPQASSSQSVGRARFDFWGNDRGQVAYTFQNRAVVKSITRLNVAPVTRNTTYAAMVSGEIFACTIERGRVDFARYLEFALAPSATTRGGSSLRFVDRPQIGNADAVVCTYTGEVSQAGRVYSGGGRYLCSGGTTASSGPFTVSNMRIEETRVGFDLTYQNGICEFRGRVVGVEPPE